MHERLPSPSPSPNMSLAENGHMTHQGILNARPKCLFSHDLCQEDRDLERFLLCQSPDDFIGQFNLGSHYLFDVEHNPELPYLPDVEPIRNETHLINTMDGYNAATRQESPGTSNLVSPVNEHHHDKFPSSGFDAEIDILPYNLNASTLKHHVASTVEVGALAEVISCFYDGCIKTFTRTADLDRHVLSVHNRIGHHCQVLGCSNNKGNGYCRPDKLKEHMRKKHNLIADLSYTKAMPSTLDLFD